MDSDVVVFYLYMKSGEIYNKNDCLFNTISYNYGGAIVNENEKTSSNLFFLNEKADIM